MRDFTGDWKNGCALLALFNGAVAGVVQMADVDPFNPEANIGRALQLFEV